MDEKYHPDNFQYLESNEIIRILIESSKSRLLTNPGLQVGE